MTNHTHVRKYRRTTNYGQGVAPGAGVWNDRGRSAISEETIRAEAWVASRLYAEAMAGGSRLPYIATPEDTKCT